MVWQAWKIFLVFLRKEKLQEHPLLQRDIFNVNRQELPIVTFYSRSHRIGVEMMHFSFWPAPAVSGLLRNPAR